MSLGNRTQPTSRANRAACIAQDTDRRRRDDLLRQACDALLAGDTGRAADLERQAKA